MEAEIVMKVRFAYNEPRIGDFEIDGEWSELEIIKEIEEVFPEAIDIEILEVIDAD